MDICNYHVGIDYQLGLNEGRISSHIPNGTNRTNVKDMKNPEKVPIPSGNLVLVALCEDKPSERGPFSLLGNLLLDLGHGSVVETLMSGFSSLGERTAGLTHAVKSPIASKTACVSSSNRLPFNLR
jgi:hypothetical protein